MAWCQIGDKPLSELMLNRFTDDPRGKWVKQRWSIISSWGMCFMMTSSNGNIFRVTGHLCGEFTGEFTAQRPVTRSFDVFFHLCLNKRLSKQSGSWWFETPLRPLWRHCSISLENCQKIYLKNIISKRSSWTPMVQYSGDTKTQLCFKSPTYGISVQQPQIFTL